MLKKSSRDLLNEEKLNDSEINLILNNYNDIFSSFDARSYSHKALSDDFLQELKRASRDKTRNFYLRLLLHKSKRNIIEETVIVNRLKDHFEKHRLLLQEEKRGMISSGLVFTFLGVLFMAAASLVLLKNQNNTLLLNFLIILLEPAGWFLFWEGLYQIVFESKHINPDLQFYNKMSTCKVEFGSV